MSRPKSNSAGRVNPAAFDAYLRASKAYSSFHNGKDVQTAIAGFAEAIRLDPSYALAFVGRSRALTAYADNFATGPAVRETFDKARADALKAIALAGELASGHLALAAVFDTGDLDFVRTSEEFERAAALAPGNASVLRDYGRFAVWMGRADFGIATARRAVVVDPLNAISHSHLGQALFLARRYDEAIAAYQDYQALDPGDPAAYSGSGLAHYVLGDFQGARTSCETKPDFWESQLCLAVTYDKLARRPDAEAVLAKLRAVMGGAGAYQYATIYAQWGQRAKALEWLETALRLRDPGLVQLKTDPLLDPLRKEPGFQAIERELKFPT
jgi:tetratricopeptide (TPR) repeat protein